MSLRSRLSPQQVVGAIYVGVMFMSIIDTTAVNVALPSLARQFGVPPSSTGGVVVGYLVSLAVWIPAAGWVGDRVGTKRTFLFALGVFTGASALCGLAGSVGLLVVFRVLQGVGGGMLLPTGMAMLYRAFPPAERARAARILVIPTVVAPALGPILGGLLVDHLSWRWVFYVNLPVGLAAFTFGLLALPEHRESTAGRLDLPGFLLSASGFALLMYALTEAASSGWTSPGIWAPALAGAALVALLVRVELRRREPLIALRLLRNRLFGVANLTSLFATGGFLGLLFVAPLYLQASRGASAFAAGSSTAPEAIGVLVTSQLVGRIYPRVGPRRLLAGGLFWVSACTVLLATVMDRDLWVIRGVMFAVGAGWSCVVIAMQAGAFAQISSRDSGRASSLYSAQRQLASALGVAVLATVVGQQAGTQSAVHVPAAPFHTAFLVSAAFALAASLTALAIRDRDAAATMRSTGRAAARRVPEPEPLLAEGPRQL
jgi:EmrB/QacA subfamily drug resistance transporter